MSTPPTLHPAVPSKRLSAPTRTLRHTRFEAAMMFRQRTTMLTVVGVPIALVGLAMITGPTSQHDWSSLLSSWLVLVSAFSLLFAVPSALAGRRESLLFKRMLTSELSPGQIMLSLLGPFFLIGIGQGLVMSTAFIVLGASFPAHPALLVVALVGCPLVAVVLGVALGALSPTAERSQWTVFPVMIAAAIAANFLLSPTIDPLWRQVMLLLPLASFVDLGARAMALPERNLVPIIEPLAGFAPAIDIAIQLAWVVAAVVVARHTWRWEPRG